MYNLWRTRPNARSRVFTKVIALFVILTFVFPFIGWAFEVKNLSSQAGSVIFQHKPVFLDKNLATVTESYQADGPLVVYIQDLHCNYEVQNNIAKIIASLVREQGLSLVAVEGASQPVDVSRLSRIPKTWLRQEIANYLMQQGKITGTEYLAGTQPGNLRLEGIESQPLYDRNLNQVLKFLNDETQGSLLDIREGLDSLKPAIYNPALQRLDAKKVAFRENQLSLLKYARFLQNRAAESKLVLGDYPVLWQYLTPPSIASAPALDTDLLYREMEQIDQALRQPLYTTPEQKRLDQLSVRLALIEKLLNVSALPEELNSFRRAPQEYSLAQFRNFFTQHESIQALIQDIDFGMLEQYLQEVLEFYRIADRRSQVFVQNTLTRMQAQHTQLAVLVTGGYHTAEVLQGLRAAHVSYMCVRPALNHPDAVNPYFAILRGQKTAMEKLLAQKENILAPRLAFSVMDPLFQALLTTLQDIGMINQKIAHPDTVVDPRIDALTKKAEINPQTGTRIVELEPGLSLVVRPSPERGIEAKASPGCQITLGGVQATLMNSETLATVKHALLRETQPVQMSFRFWNSFTRMLNKIERSISTVVRPQRKPARFMSVLPERLVRRWANQWFGEDWGPRLSLAYVTVIGPMIETLVFPAVAALAVGTGLWWAALGFTVAHTIVEWLVRAKQVGWRQAFSPSRLLLDLRDFTLRFGLGTLFYLPFQSANFLSAIIQSFLMHSVYNLAALFYNRLLADRIALPGLRAWLTVPLAMLGSGNDHTGPHIGGLTPAAEIKKSAHAFTYTQADFSGVDWEHFVHAQEILSRRALTQEQEQKILALLQTKRKAITGDFYTWVYQQIILDSKHYTAELIEVISGDSYSDPRLGITVFGQNKRPRAQAIYEAVSNCLDALGLEIGQFGKGVKQAVDWLEATGSDRIDVFTRQADQGLQLTLLQDTMGQNYIQMQTVTPHEIESRTGQTLTHGTILSISVANSIPRTIEQGNLAEDARHRVSQEEIIAGIHKRFPYVTQVDMRTKTAGEQSEEKVNGFYKKKVLMGKQLAEQDLENAKERQVRIEVSDHRIVVTDNGSGMNSQNLARMFVPKQGSKQSPPLSGAEAVAELAKVKVVEDAGMPRRMSFSRNGEVIVAVDIPRALVFDATAPGGLMLEFGRLLDVPESRDKINIPAGLDPTEEPNFQRAVRHAVRELVNSQQLSLVEKIRAINTLTVGLEGLIGGNSHYEHAVSSLLSDIKKSMTPILSQARESGYLLLPHAQEFAKLNPGPQFAGKVIFLNERIFDWQGAYSLKAIGGEIVPGITLGGEKQLPLVVAPFQSDWLTAVDSFHPEWHSWTQSDRLPLIKTDQFIVIPTQLAGRLLELATLRAAGTMNKAQQKILDQEFASLAERINILTAEKVATHYEVEGAEQNLGIQWQTQFNQRAGEIDSAAVNRFLTQLPDYILNLIQKVGGEIPQRAQQRVMLMADGTLREVGTAKLLRSGVKQFELLAQGYLQVEYENEMEIMQPEKAEIKPVKFDKAKKHMMLSPDKTMFMLYENAAREPDGWEQGILYYLDTDKIEDKFGRKGFDDVIPVGHTAIFGKYPQFTADARRISFLTRDEIETYIVSYDLNNVKNGIVRAAQIILGPPTMKIDDAQYVVSQRAPLAYVEIGNEVWVVDLRHQKVVMQGKNIKVHTDSTGLYTALIDSKGQLQVYLHQTGTLLNIPVPIEQVTTYWMPNDPEPKFYTAAIGGQEYAFTANGESTQMAAGALANSTHYQMFSKNGVACVGLPRVEPDRVWEAQTDAQDRPGQPDVYYDPAFHLIVHKKSDSQLVTAIDPMTGKGSEFEGKLAGYDPKLGMVYRDGEQWVQQSASGDKIMNLETAAVDGIPARYVVTRFAGKYQLIRLEHKLSGQGRETIELNQEVPSEFSTVNFDGQYFVFGNPKTGEVIYLDPNQPTQVVLVANSQQQLMPQAQGQAPPDAAQQYMVNKQGQVVDVRSGRTLSGIRDAKALRGVGFGYILVQYEDSQELIYPEASDQIRIGSGQGATFQVSPQGRYAYCLKSDETEMNHQLIDLKTRKTHSVMSILNSQLNLPELSRLSKPIFSEDGTRMVVLLTMGKKIYLFNLNLTTPEGPTLQAMVDLSAAGFKILVELEMELSPYSNMLMLHKTYGGLAMLIDLNTSHNPVVVNEPEVRFRTDTSGAYTAIIYSGGEMVLYFHKTGRVITGAHLGGKLTAIATMYGMESGAPVIKAMVDGNKLVLLTETGESKPVQFFEEFGYGEGIDNTGKIQVISDVHKTRLHNNQPNPVQNMQHDKLFKHPNFPVWIDRRNPHQTCAVDMKNNAVIPIEGEMVFYESSQKFAFMVSPEGYFKVGTNGEEIKDFRDQPHQVLVVDHSPTAHYVLKNQQGEIFVLYENHYGTPLAINQDFSSVYFDGKYFVFCYPDKNEVVYVDPAAPEKISKVSLGKEPAVILESRPAEAQLPFEIVQTHQGLQIRDTTTGKMTGPFFLQLVRLNDNSFIGQTREMEWLTFQPAMDNKPFSREKSEVYLVKGDKIVFREQEGTGRYLIDLSTQQRFPAAGFSEQIAISSSGQYSVHVDKQMQLSYYDHAQPNPEPRVISTFPNALTFFMPPLANAVVFEHIDKSCSIFSLETGRVVGQPSHHIEVDSSGVFAISEDIGLNGMVSIRNLKNANTTFENSREIYLGADDSHSYVWMNNKIKVYQKNTGTLVKEFFRNALPEGQTLPEIWENFTRQGKGFVKLTKFNDGAPMEYIPDAPRVDYSSQVSLGTQVTMLQGSNVVTYSVETNFKNPARHYVAIQNLQQKAQTGQIREKHEVGNSYKNMEPLMGGQVLIAPAPVVGNLKVWANDQMVEYFGGKVNASRTFVLGRKGQSFTLMDRAGREYDLTKYLGKLVPGDVDGDYFVLYDQDKQQARYLDPRVVQDLEAGKKTKTRAATANLARMQKALDQWKDQVLSQREALIKQVQLAFQPLLEQTGQLSEPIKAPLLQSLLPKIEALYQRQQSEVEAKFAVILQGGKLVPQASEFYVNQCAQRLHKLIAGVPGFLQSMADQVDQERSLVFKQEFYSRLFTTLLAMSENSELTPVALTAEDYRTIALGYQIENQSDMESLTVFKHFIRQLVPHTRASLEVPAKLIQFLSQAAKQSPEQRRVVEKQIARFAEFGQTHPEAFRKYLQRMLSAFEAVELEDLSGYLQDEAKYANLGDAKDFAFFLTHAVEPVREQQREIPAGEDVYVALQGQGIQLSQIISLEEQRPKRDAADLVMPVEEAIAAIQADLAGVKKMPAASQPLELDLLRNTEVQREAGAYTAEIAQNSLDATQGKRGELVVDFYCQQIGEQREFVEEARDNGTGALQEVALLIPKSTKALGEQIELTGYFGTGKFTIFEGVDRVEIITKNKQRAYLFGFTVEKDTSGRAVAIHLSRIRRVQDASWAEGVTVRRIKQAENTIPELDQTLAKRAWKTFAGLSPFLSAHGDFHIFFLDQEQKLEPLNIKAPVLLGQVPFQAARMRPDGTYPELRIVSTQDMPLQIVDKAGLRISEIKEEYLALIPESLRDFKKSLKLNIQIPLPLIRDRSGFEHEDQFLPEIQKYVALAFYQAIAYKTMTQTSPQFVFTGFPRDWETNEQYWESAGRVSDPRILQLAKRINQNQLSAISPQELEQLLPAAGRMDQATLFVKLILLLEVASDLKNPQARYSLMGRGLAIQAELHQARAEAIRQRLGLSRSIIPGRDQIAFFADRVEQANTIEEGHEQLRHPERYIVEAKTQNEQTLIRMAKQIAEPFGFSKIILVSEEVLFAGAFAGDRIYLNRSLAAALGMGDAAGVDHATNTIIHELAHLLEMLMQSNAVKLENGQSYMPELADFTHQPVGLFAEGMKYIAAISLFRYQPLAQPENEQVKPAADENGEEFFPASILPARWVQAKALEWFGTAWGPRVARVYLSLLAPIWETLLFPMLAITAVSFGMGWAVLGFAAAHTIVEWLVRAKEMGWQEAWHPKRLQQDFKAFLWRSAIGYLFYLPFAQLSLLSAAKVAVGGHMLYNLCSQFYNTLVVARIRNSQWRGWMKAPLLFPRSAAEHEAWPMTFPRFQAAWQQQAFQAGATLEIRTPGSRQTIVFSEIKNTSQGREVQGYDEHGRPAAVNAARIQWIRVLHANQPSHTRDYAQPLTAAQQAALFAQREALLKRLKINPSSQVTVVGPEARHREEPGKYPPLLAKNQWETRLEQLGASVQLYNTGSSRSLWQQAIYKLLWLTAGQTKMRDRALFEQTPPPANSQDLVVVSRALSSQSYSPLTQRIRLAEQMVRALKPGGYLIAGWQNQEFFPGEEAAAWQNAQALQDVIQSLQAQGYRFDRIAQAAEPVSAYNQDWSCYQVFAPGTQAIAARQIEVAQTGQQESKPAGAAAAQSATEQARLQMQTQANWFEQIPVNAPILKVLSPWLRQLPGLRRLRLLIGSCALGSMSLGQAQVLGEPRDNTALRTLLREWVPQISAELVKGGHCQIAELTLAKLGIWNWLKGQVFGDYQDTENEQGLVFYLPRSVLCQLNTGEQSLAYRRTRAYRMAYWLAGQMIAHQNQNYLTTLSPATVAVSRQEQELSGANEAQGYTPFTAESGQGMTPAEYLQAQKAEVNITQAQLLGIVIRQLDASTHRELQKALAPLFSDWLQKEPNLQTLLNAVEALPAISHPILLTLQSLLQEARTYASPAQRVVVNGVLANVLALQAEPVSTPAVIAGQRAVKGIKVMGLPKIEAARLLILLETMQQTAKGQARDILRAVTESVRQAAGQSTQAVVTVALEPKLQQVLAGVLATAPSQQGIQVGEEYNQKIYATINGVKPIQLAFGSVAMPCVVEVTALKDSLENIQQQSQQGRYQHGNSARVFEQRRAIPGLIKNHLPRLLSLSRLLGQSIPKAWMRSNINTALMQFNPVGWYQAALRALPIELQNTATLQALRQIDLNSQDPLALAYRSWLSNPTPENRQRFAKIVLNIVRGALGTVMSQSATPEAREQRAAWEWVAFSEFISQLGGIPTVCIAKMDLVAGKESWQRLPDRLQRQGFLIPIGFFKLKGGKGALGFVVSHMETHPAFIVDHQVLRLFLRKAISRFSAAA